MPQAARALARETQASAPELSAWAPEALQRARFPGEEVPRQPAAPEDEWVVADPEGARPGERAALSPAVPTAACAELD